MFLRNIIFITGCIAIGCILNLPHQILGSPDFAENYQTVRDTDDGTAYQKSEPRKLKNELLQDYFSQAHVQPLKEIISFVQLKSPKHLYYLFYDSTYEEIADTLTLESGSRHPLTVVRFTEDSDSAQDIISAPLSRVSTGRRGVFLFCSLENMTKIFMKISSESLESRSVWWILLMPSPETVKVLTKILREGSLVLILQMETEHTFKILRSDVDRAGEVGFKEIGTLRKSSIGFEGRLEESIFVDLDKLYSNLKGRELTATAVLNNFPFIHLATTNDGAIIGWEGFEHSMIEALGKSLNFTYRMVSPTDGKWGGPLPNGTIEGLIGDVATRRADFSICELTITGLRETVVDFSYPYYIEPATIISRSPLEKNRAFAAFSPFSPESWLCIVMAVVLIGLVLYTETHLSVTYSRIMRDGYTFSDSLFNAFRVLLKQENLLSDHLWPQRFTFLFWYLFCLIISVLYSGMLTATLVKPSFEKPIDGLADLPAATKDGFTLVISVGTSYEYMFKYAEEGIYAETWKLFNHKDRSKSFRRNREAFDEIIEEKLVLFGGDLYLKYQATIRGRSRFYFARNTFAPQFYGVPCATGSPLIPVFNRMFSYMVEGGLITKWVDNEFQKAGGSAIVITQRGPKPFGIMHLQAAFYILCIGFVTASVAFITEKLTHYLIRSSSEDLIFSK